MAERLEPAYSNYDYTIWTQIRSTQQIAAAAVFAFISIVLEAKKLNENLNKTRTLIHQKS